jgi:glyoxylase-like metal-dependent hydrolase (beta-lactamase superfamily II)
MHVEDRYYRFEIGQFACLVISDGTLMTPIKHPESLAKKVPRYFPEHGQVMDMNLLVIRTGENTVLIDTGMGVGNEATAGKMLENLRAADVKPGEIDTVILTHCHVDHIGGNADNNGKPNFPNARYVIHKAEWDYWKPRLSLPKDKLNPHELIHIEFMKRYLLPIMDKVDIISDKNEIVPGIGYLLAPGHTPGGMMLKIASGNKQLLCVGDLLHDIIEAEAPHAYAIWDVDSDRASITREKVIPELIAANTYIFSAHLAFPGLGYFIKKDKTWGWQPI